MIYLYTLAAISPLLIVIGFMFHCEGLVKGLKILGVFLSFVSLIVIVLWGITGIVNTFR
jgi:hypothetical protein